MANPTTNYGWQMPTSTDLVTDLPADFEVFGQAVDTSLLGLKGGTTGQVLSKTSGTDMAFTWATDSSGIPATIVDAKGDIIAGTAADAVSRLAVGANDTVLTADSTTATGMKWAAAAAPTASFSLINAGGTTLTAATTITVSGISGMAQLLIYVEDASSVNASSYISIQFNADAGNHNFLSAQIVASATYSSTLFGTQNSGVTTEVILGQTSSNPVTRLNGTVMVFGCNSSGIKTFQSIGGGTANTNQRLYTSGGFYSGTSTISSIKIISSTGNFDNGKIFIYGSAV